MTENLNNRVARMRGILEREFSPVRLEIEDESARHAGHAGASEGGQTHYNVLLISPMFAGMGRLARSRAVHAALQVEFGDGLHALSLVLRGPGEV
jgi:BolA protein